MIERDEDPWVDWIAAEARRPIALGPAARERLLAAVRAEPRPTPQHRPWLRLFERRTIALSPLASLAAAAGLVGIGVLAGALIHRDGFTAGPPKEVVESSRLPVHDTVRVVKFVLVAPQAKEVALVGDFNRWDARATPMTRTPTGGTWSVALEVAPGRHLYAFVVDGTQWLADPTAPLAPEDGFGAANSVLLVGESHT
jgi:hypothetical protein